MRQSSRSKRQQNIYDFTKINLTILTLVTKLHKMNLSYPLKWVNGKVSLLGSKQNHPPILIGLLPNEQRYQELCQALKVSNPSFLCSLPIAYAQELANISEKKAILTSFELFLAFIRIHS